MLTPRWYQSESIEKTHLWLNSNATGNPAIILPTGAGKTLVIATLAGQVAEWGGRVTVLSHVKELVEHTRASLMYTAPGLPVGVYSAGLKERDLGYPITVASIQSIYKRAFQLGRQTLVIVDELQLVPFDGEGMYRTFFNDCRLVNPSMRAVGLTATPYRLRGAGGVSVIGPDLLFNDVSYEVGVRELIEQGFLSRLRTKKPRAGVSDGEGVKKRGGEFIAGDLEAAMDDDDTVRAACAEILAEAAGRSSILVFASGRQHAAHIASCLAELGQRAEVVHGDTPAGERTRLVDQFKAGSLRFLININVFTTGFDATNVDCVVMLRPTMSPGLYYQMVGRGFRLHPGKQDCLVLDFAGNVARHGPIDELAAHGRWRKASIAQSSGTGESPAKECPACREIIGAGYGRCPECGYEFPPPAPRHDRTAGTENILGGGSRTYNVSEVIYHAWEKRNAGPDAPMTMCVEYVCGMNKSVREWVCIEHSGFARTRAEAWWAERCLIEDMRIPPADAHEAVFAVQFAKSHSPSGFREPASIVVEKDGNGYDRIIAYQWPDPAQPSDRAESSSNAEAAVTVDGIPLDEIPF